VESLDIEQRNAVRRAISGQDEEPVVLTTDPGGEGVTGNSHDQPHAHAPLTEEFQIDGDAVLAKMQVLYPGHFSHAVAEVKIDLLVKLLEER
jgi:hypothetical protein